MRVWPLFLLALAACAHPPPESPANALNVPVMAVASRPIESVPEAAPPPDIDIIRAARPLPTEEEVVGAPAPGFTLGRASLRYHRVTVVTFWATWCGPCRRELPQFDALYAKYKERGLDVIGVSVDDESEGVASYARDLQLRFPTGWDDGHKITELYRPATMPQTYIVDRAGKVRFVYGGVVPSTIDDDIEKLL